MNRIALAGLLAVAACDVPLVMIEVENPETCVTKVVDVDPLTLDYAIANLDPDGDLPSEMAANLTSQLGTTIELDDNLIDLPEEAKDLLDLEVQFKLVRITALAPHDDALDYAAELSIAIVPEAASGLAERTILSFSRSVPAAGAPVEASGDSLNLAEYLYSGQLRFKYALDAVVDVAEPWQAEVTTCIGTRGKVAVSYEDLGNL